MSEITHKSLRPARVHLSARLKLIGISEKDAVNKAYIQGEE